MLHLPIQIHKALASGKKLTRFDRLIFIISFLYPLSTLPQAVQTLSGNVAGVSVFSWSMYLVCAGLFLTYGLRHKVVPMIISNSLWVLVDSLVLFGLISHLKVFI